MHHYLYQILKDNRITKTQKYIFFVILALDEQQNHPQILELPIRSLEEYDVRGHGHIKPSLDGLKDTGYLLDIGWIQREDGYRVTSVVINRQLSQIFPQEETKNDENEPEDVA